MMVALSLLMYCPRCGNVLVELGIGLWSCYTNSCNGSFIFSESETDGLCALTWRKL